MEDTKKPMEALGKRALAGDNYVDMYNAFGELISAIRKADFSGVNGRQYKSECMKVWMSIDWDQQT